MFGPPLVVLGSVTQGSATTPTTVCISPDRKVATDTSVKRVRKFEDQLTNSVDMHMYFVTAQPQPQPNSTST